VTGAEASCLHECEARKSDYNLGPLGHYAAEAAT
jgi:hypothetical protein